ncbi:hypothetical protein B0H16DRAFT_1476408 [Mycena metata]|uniref:Uncharacterized protein n=1 Tax=Mycena metata TaxID=1033252 RepID=A0AAD7MGW5_9AGAR|nr:hypothetical protein B0H16DRAFT_1476408 [Mycena metata]
MWRWESVVQIGREFIGETNPFSLQRRGEISARRAIQAVLRLRIKGKVISQGEMRNLLVLDEKEVNGRILPFRKLSLIKGHPIKALKGPKGLTKEITLNKALIRNTEFRVLSFIWKKRDFNDISVHERAENHTATLRLKQIEHKPVPLTVKVQHKYVVCHIAKFRRIGLLEIDFLQHGALRGLNTAEIEEFQHEWSPHILRHLVGLDIYT